MTPDHLECLTKRRDFLTARIAAKLTMGWEDTFDRMERDALSAVLDYMQEQEDWQKFGKWLTIAQSGGSAHERPDIGSDVPGGGAV